MTPLSPLSNLSVARTFVSYLGNSFFVGGCLFLTFKYSADKVVASLVTNCFSWVEFPLVPCKFLNIYGEGFDILINFLFECPFH